MEGGNFFMYGRIFVCALCLAATFCIAACGGEKQSTNVDKAVLAYAQLMTQGKSDDATAAGLTDADKAEISKTIVDGFIAGIAEVAPLSDESAQAVTAAFYERFAKDMKFTATVKQGDAKQPVVELKTTPIDYNGTLQAASKIDEWLALMGMVGQLKAEGVTDSQLRTNKDFQNLTVVALKKFINAAPLQGEKSFDVTCAKVKGSDGKEHWAPADLDAFTKFLTGQQ